jgi:REP element-mobilizing transposase RayT
MSFQRRLPHWNPEDAAIFLTWRLHGSLPPPEPEWIGLPAGKRFAAEDQVLVRATGPHYLKDARVAEAVADTFHFAAEVLKIYELHAWVSMSNHVHLLIQPGAPLARITRSIKSYSAKEANAILGRTGEPFWQIESYDHWVRSSDNLSRSFGILSSIQSKRDLSPTRKNGAGPALGKEQARRPVLHNERQGCFCFGVVRHTSFGEEYLLD